MGSEKMQDNDDEDIDDQLVSKSMVADLNSDEVKEDEAESTQLEGNQVVFGGRDEFLSLNEDISGKLMDFGIRTVT